MLFSQKPFIFLLKDLKVFQILQSHWGHDFVLIFNLWYHKLLVVLGYILVFFLVKLITGILVLQIILRRLDYHEMFFGKQQVQILIGNIKESYLANVLLFILLNVHLRVYYLCFFFLFILFLVSPLGLSLFPLRTIRGISSLQNILGKPRPISKPSNLFLFTFVLHFLQGNQLAFAANLLFEHPLIINKIINPKPIFPFL